MCRGNKIKLMQFDISSFDCHLRNVPTDLQVSILPVSIFNPSMTISAAMIALVVAIAGIILPAIAEIR